MARSPKLYAPDSYREATAHERKTVCNGVGPAGKGWMMPDTIYGLSMTESANIHDWMYELGFRIEHKDEADRVFLNNMLRTIDVVGSWDWLAKLRRKRAMKYYWAVKNYGGPSFWAGKAGGSK